jgi:hypothetical protein
MSFVGTSALPPGARRPFRPVQKEIPFMTWIQTNYRADANLEKTHGFMGANYEVSVRRNAELVNEVYDRYLAAIHKGEDVCMDEILTEYFPMFFDFDLYQEQPIDKEFLYEISSVTAMTVADFFPDLKAAPPEGGSDDEGGKHARFQEPFIVWEGSGKGNRRLRIMVSLATEVNEAGEDVFAVRENKDGKMYWKAGIHINCIGRLWVNKQMARSIALTVQHRLDIKFPRSERNGQKPWADVVDLNVYNRRMRMLYCSKASKCDACTGVQSQVVKKLRRDPNSMVSCEKCSDRRIVFKPRCYLPWLVLDYQGNVDPNADWILGNPAVALRAASLRTCVSQLGEPNYYRETADVPLDTESIDKARARKMKLHAKPGADAKANAPTRVGEEYSPDGVEGTTLGTHLRNLRPEWAGLRITKIKHTNHGVFDINVGGAGNNWCHIKGSKHSKSVISFQIRMTGIYQRCWSPKQRCKGKWSVAFPITDDLRTVLFIRDIQDGTVIFPRHENRTGRADESESSDGDEDDTESAHGAVPKRVYQPVRPMESDDEDRGNDDRSEIGKPETGAGAAREDDPEKATKRRFARFSSEAIVPSKANHDAARHKDCMGNLPDTHYLFKLLKESSARIFPEETYQQSLANAQKEAVDPSGAAEFIKKGRGPRKRKEDPYSEMVPL